MSRCGCSITVAYPASLCSAQTSEDGHRDESFAGHGHASAATGKHGTQPLLPFCFWFYLWAFYDYRAGTEVSCRIDRPLKDSCLLMNILNEPYPSFRICFLILYTLHAHSWKKYHRHSNITVKRMRLCTWGVQRNENSLTLVASDLTQHFYVRSTLICELYLFQCQSVSWPRSMSGLSPAAWHRSYGQRAPAPKILMHM